MGYQVLFQTLPGSVYLGSRGHLALKGRVYRGRNVSLRAGLTLLLGRGLSELATPPENPEAEGQVGHRPCALYRCSATTATCWRRWLLCLVWVCALGSALLSISRLNCHPGNLRGEPQLGEGPTEASPSSRAGSVPPHFSRKPVCHSPHVSPLPSASGADSVHLTHSLGTGPPAVCCGVTRVSLPTPRPSPAGPLCSSPPEHPGFATSRYHSSGPSGCF